MQVLSTHSAVKFPSDSLKSKAGSIQRCTNFFGRAVKPVQNITQNNCYNVNQVSGFFSKKRLTLRQRKASTSAQLGFTTGSDRNIKQSAEDLLHSASSLLIFQSALKGPIPQKFIAVLMALARTNDQLKIRQAYGEFYSALASKGADSWQDFLVERLQRGAENPLAIALEKGEKVDHLLAAARADLNTLQRLALTEATLASWVFETCTGGSDDRDAWLNAASTLTTRPSPSSSCDDAGGDGGGSSPLNPLGGASALPTEEAPVSEDSMLSCDDHVSVLRPIPPAADLAALRQHVAGQWAWASALDELCHYWKTYGAGVVGHNNVLTWKDGVLMQGTLQGYSVSEDNSKWIEDRYRSRLTEFVSWEPGSNPKSMFMWGRTPEKISVAASILLKQAAEEKPRVVLCSPQILNNNPENKSSAGKLAAVLRQHPRAQFLIVVERVSMTRGHNTHRILSSMKWGMSSESLPRNAALFVTGSSSELDSQPHESMMAEGMEVRFGSRARRLEEEDVAAYWRKVGIEEVLKVESIKMTADDLVDKENISET